MKQTEMKSNVLQKLIEAMLGETGGRMKPKVVTIDVIKPKEGESLEDVLDEASDKAPAMGTKDVDGDGDHDADDHEMAEEDDEEMCEGGEMKPRMSLSQFLSRK